MTDIKKNGNKYDALHFKACAGYVQCDKRTLPAATRAFKILEPMTFAPGRNKKPRPAS